MLTPSMGRMSLSRATGTLTVTDRPEVLNRVQQLVNRENESITKQVLLNVNVLSVALAQVVVTAVQCQVALVDAIHTHVLACDAVQPTGQDRTSAVTVLQAADLVGQARVGVAIDLGLAAADGTRTRDPRRDRPVF